MILKLANSTEYSNPDSIDRVGHRIGVIPIKESNALETLYKLDKEKFYQELEVLVPIESVLLEDVIE